MDHRNERITEAIREELTELIGYEMTDPRVAGAVVTDVHVSPDRKRAIVRVGVGQDADSKEVLLALEGARHFLRAEITRRLELFRTPDLRFEIDPTAALGPKLNQLLRRIQKGRPR